MITGELKNKIDQLWTTFWTGGLTNPLDVIEQMTYLMFIHDLDELDNARTRDAVALGVPYKSIFDGKIEFKGQTVDASMLKWSSFKDLTPEEMFDFMSNCVFPFIKNLDSSNKESAFSTYMSDAIFKIPTPKLLDKIVAEVDAIYGAIPKGQDAAGDVYEYLLSKIATAGVNGQFRTPRHIIEMMVNLVAPTPTDVVCDPAFGTAGFLVAVGNYLKKEHEKEVMYNAVRRDHYMNHMFHGFDMDRTMLRIGAMNMMKHGIERPFIEYRDSLSAENADRDKYTLVLANPPFKGSLDCGGVAPDLLKICKTKKTELLFLALFLQLLQKGGRCACIVPDGVLFGSSGAHKAIRKEIVDKHILQAVISMPSGVFKPYAVGATAILIFTKTGHGGTENVWFYDMQADGYSLDDKRDPIGENDIPDIVERFHNLDDEKTRNRIEQSFLVPKKEIVDNAYDLSINKYKKIEYVPTELPSSKEIMQNLENLNEEINAQFEELKKLLGM